MKALTGCRPARALAAAALSALLAASLGAARAPTRDDRMPSPSPMPDARTIMLRADEALHYAGHDMRAKVRMELGSGETATRFRTMTMLRWNAAPGGEQRYLLYFHQPGDARRMSCMVYKHVGTADERWMYVPVMGHVQRVQSPDRSSFLGSDFVREEFSGRDVDADTHRLVGRERLNERDCYVVESVPRKSEEFARCVSWIDAEGYLPLQQEFWNRRGVLTRVLTYARVETFPSRTDPRINHPCAREWTARNVLSGHWTRIDLDSIVYDIGLKESDFVQSHLLVQPGDWLP